MDLKLTDGDLDITNGELSFVTGIDAVRQDVEMALGTWLEETPYDKNAGLPYLQIIFRKGTSIEAIRFIVENAILARKNVTEVLRLDTTLDSQTRELTITGRLRALNQEIDFSLDVTG